MSRFHGYLLCVTCGSPNANGHFLDLNGERFCLPCYVLKVNPEHPSTDEMKAAKEQALATWKCAKWSRDDYKLPNGPLSVS